MTEPFKAADPAWEVVSDQDEATVHSEVEDFEMASVSEDAVSFERAESASAPDSVSELTARGSPSDSELSLSRLGGFSLVDPEPAAETNDLAALAAAASGDPDTFSEIGLDECDRHDSAIMFSETIDERPAEEDEVSFLIEDDEDVAFTDELTLDDETPEDSSDAALKPMVAGSSDKSDALEFQEADSSQIEFEAEAKPTRDVAAILKPRASSAGQRSVAPEIVLDLAPVQRKRRGSPLALLFSVVLGGCGAFPVAQLLIWYFLGTDPFEAGPVVAQFAPWIVPEGLRGSQSAPIGQLPSMQSPPGLPAESIPLTEPSMVLSEPAQMADDGSSPNADSPTDPITGFSLPPASTATSSATPNEKSPEEILDSSIFAVAKPGQEKASEPLPKKPTGPQRNEVGELSSTPIVALSDTPAPKKGKKNLKPAKATDEPPPDSEPVNANQIADEALRNALAQIDVSFNKWDKSSTSSKNALVKAIHEFGLLMAKIPSNDRRLAMWRNQAMPIISEVVGNDAMYKEVLAMDVKRDAAAKPSAGWVGVDFVMIESASMDGADKIWKPKVRFRSPLDKFPLQAAESSEPENDVGSRYWVLGVIEKSKLMEGFVFRSLVAVRK